MGDDDMGQEGMERDFYYILYTLLLAMCPRDTGNMIANIELNDLGDSWEIKISGPLTTGKGYYDYAKAVNYGLSALTTGRAMSVKETRNYKWVERAIKQASALFGSEVKYELS